MLPKVTFLGHASVLVEMSGVRILTDPVLLGRVTLLDRVVPRPDAAQYQDIDVVLISHLHHDHCDLRSLRLLDDPTIIVPPGAGRYLQHKGFQNVFELAVNAVYHNGSVQIRAMRAIHDGFRTPFGPRAEAIGFMITDQDASVYFAGDTDVFPQMADFRDVTVGEIDVALLPVWGWGPNLGPGHLDPVRAVQAMELLKPRLTIPIHWGTLFPYGLRMVRPSFGMLLEQPPLDFARLADEAGAPGEVLVIKPGDPAVFPP